MSQDISPPPGKATMALVALLLAAAGLFMLLHGSGAVSATWLNPNPRTPPWVFVLCGLFLLAGSLLSLAPVVKLPGRATTLAGYAAVAIGMVMANWLVFLAEGASCSVEGGGAALAAGGLLCRGVAGAVVILFDVLLAAAAVPALWRRIASRKT